MHFATILKIESCRVLFVFVMIFKQQVLDDLINLDV